jgi:hypothetical protein
MNSVSSVRQAAAQFLLLLDCIVRPFSGLQSQWFGAKAQSFAEFKTQERDKSN